MSSESTVEAATAVDQGAEPSYAFANKIGRIVFLALEEVAGPDNTGAILRSARLQERLEELPPDDFVAGFSFDELSRIQRATEELYGPTAGRRIARRVGRACFRLSAEDLQPLLGVADILFRILPLRTRLRIGFQVLAHLSDRFSDQIVHLDENPQYFYWITERCGVCWGRQSDGPCCDLIIGLLEEVLYWLSGGASFYMEETSCIAAGDPTCTIVIGKEPLMDAPPSED